MCSPNSYEIVRKPSHMGRLSVSLNDEQLDWIDEKVEDGDAYESKSALVRECVRRYEKVDELEATVSDLRRQLQAANRENENVEELAEYVEEERSLQREERERRRAPLMQRIKWLIWGYND